MTVIQCIYEAMTMTNVYVLFLIDFSRSCQLIFFFFSVRCSGLRIKFCHDMRKKIGSVLTENKMCVCAKDGKL